MLPTTKHSERATMSRRAQCLRTLCREVLPYSAIAATTLIFPSECVGNEKSPLNSDDKRHASFPTATSSQTLFSFFKPKPVEPSVDISTVRKRGRPAKLHRPGPKAKPDVSELNPSATPRTLLQSRLDIFSDDTEFEFGAFTSKIPFISRFNLFLTT